MAAKRRSGRTQSNDERGRQTVGFRLTPAEIEDVDRLAEAHGVARARYVELLVTQHIAATRERTSAA